MPQWINHWQIYTKSKSQGKLPHPHSRRVPVRPSAAFVREVLGPAPSLSRPPDPVSAMARGGLPHLHHQMGKAQYRFGDPGLGFPPVHPVWQACSSCPHVLIRHKVFSRYFSSKTLCRMTACGQTKTHLPHWMHKSDSQTGISRAILRFSHLVVPVGKVPSTGMADTGTVSPS